MNKETNFLPTCRRLTVGVTISETRLISLIILLTMHFYQITHRFIIDEPWQLTWWTWCLHTTGQMGCLSNLQNIQSINQMQFNHGVNSDKKEKKYYLELLTVNSYDWAIRRKIWNNSFLFCWKIFVWRCSIVYIVLCLWCIISS